MSMTLFNHLENALESLKSNRLRTLLTITGVTIGVASIVCVLSLASGAVQSISSQTKEVEGRIAVIRSRPAAGGTPLMTDYQSSHLTNDLTTKDVSALSSKLGTAVVPIAALSTKMSSRDSTVNGSQASLVGSNQDLESVANLTLVEGNFISSETNAGIVLGNQLSIDLFGTDHAIGNLMTIREQNFTVIGTLEPTDKSSSYLQIDFDNSAIVSVDSIKQFTQGVPQIQQIIISANKDSGMQAIADQSKKILEANHFGESKFNILTGSAITQPTGEMFSSLTILIASVAGIALVVGGIGIMNIMLVNVAERRREVGIRKAIGATDSHVINQFLIESSMIGLLGGLLGYALGVGTAYAMSLYLPFAPVLQWQVAVLSIGIAIATGILFGIYPAIKAAKKDPIESLRY